MFIRFLFPALSWTCLMMLIFFRHYGYDQKWNWSGFTNDSLMHGVLFLGSTHIWLGVFKKQLKFQFIRKNAYPMVLLLGISMAVVVEIVRYYGSFTIYFNFWNLFFDLIGITMGIGTFRLLYRSCC